MSMIIQIRRWLKQTKVWRFVGFVSAVVGLVCYALSSSFNHLFGNWNLLKIILYTIFSFITSFMVLYAMIWPSSRSHRFKAHTAFLVLTITSVYSFFFEKVVNGKPDAYSLLSCAAFSIMSMSLSRQPQCGFEVDLLYFFLGCLIVLLMMIKLQLFILGAGFSYSLIILRSSFTSLNTTAEQEYLQLPAENSVVIEMDSLLRLGNEFSRLIQQITTSTNALQQQNLNLIVKSALHLIDNCKFVMAALPSAQIQDLHKIVKLMVASGYEKECSDVYNSWRSVFLQEFLINKIFGFPEAKINAGSEYQSEQFLNSMFERWITASDVAINILFPIEQKLCKRVFLGFSSAASRCFTEVCQKSMFLLLNFADTFASGSPTEWRFSKMLKIFEHLRDIIPKLQSLFPDSTLLNEAIAVKNRLGEASRDFFMDMDKFIFIVPEAMQVATPYGQRHQMTVNVMSCVTFVCKSRYKLEQILQEYPMVNNEVEPSSIFVKTIEQIIKMFQKILIAKSKNYKDPGLGYIFMLNNILHINTKNKICGLESILGDDWFIYNRKTSWKLVELYKRRSWNKVLGFLKLDSNGKTTEELMKEKIHLFNGHFEDIYRVQSAWFVNNLMLRKHIISSVGNVLLPAYGIFLARLHDILGNQAYKYIKYGMFEIQDQLNHLFMGQPKLEDGFFGTHLICTGTLADVDNCESVMDQRGVQEETAEEVYERPSPQLLRAKRRHTRPKGRVKTKEAKENELTETTKQGRV